MTAQYPIASIRKNPPQCERREASNRQLQALDVVLNFAQETYALTGAEQFHGLMTCSNLMREHNAHNIFSRWLSENEWSRIRRPNDRIPYYKEYHSARILRCFLRSVSIMPNVTIAGSYPCAKYLDNQRLQSWVPTDIDVFVARRSDAIILTQLYTECMWKNFRVTVTCTAWESDYYPDPDDVASDTPSGTVSDTETPTDTEPPTDTETRELRLQRLPHSEVTNQNTDTNLQGLQRRTHQTTGNGPQLHLARCISEWVNREETARIANVKPGAYRDRMILALTVCRQTAKHIPKNMYPAAYRPTETRRLKPNSQFVPSELRVASRPINIIFYGIQEDFGIPDDWSAVVCSNFDIAMCAVSLTVQADHTLQLREHMGAFSDLENKTMKLSHTAFSAPGSEVPCQMQRVLKYAMRGFTW